VRRDILINAELADATKSRPSTRKMRENKIQSAFENKAEPEFVEKTIKSFVHASIPSRPRPSQARYQTFRVAPEQTLAVSSSSLG